MHNTKGKLIFIGAGLGLASASFAQSLSSTSIVGLADPGTYIYSLNQSGASDTSIATATTDTTFNGLDSLGQSQAMEFKGTTSTNSNYGSLHSYVTGDVTNTYYNPSNANYWDGTTVNTSGSPTTLASLGFSSFNDNLTFSGVQAGYQAVYVFKFVGTNTGSGLLADLGFNVAGAATSSYFNSNSGSTSETWATSGYDATSTQNLNVQFSNQFSLNTFDVPDGSSTSGSSDFTATLEGIAMINSANGSIVSPANWSVTSTSGTQYTKLSSVPEPSSFLAVFGGLALLARRRRK